jgi:tRNA(fMet)-specific endonuclease VapC
MTYLLDTSVIVAILRDKPAHVRQRLRAAMKRDAELAASSVALFELWYGVACSNRQDENAERLRIFLSGDVKVIDFTHDDARIAGELRAGLESRGASIGAYDLLMAAQALRHGATLATANTREFSRVPKLRWQDWTKKG